MPEPMTSASLFSPLRLLLLLLLPLLLQAVRRRSLSLSSSSASAGGGFPPPGALPFSFFFSLLYPSRKRGWGIPWQDPTITSTMALEDKRYKPLTGPHSSSLSLSLSLSLSKSSLPH